MEAKNLVLVERTGLGAEIFSEHFARCGVGNPEIMTVFEFDDFRAYLNYMREHYPGLRRPITLEGWAKKLNYRSPRSIAMVLKGQRLPSEELVIAFSRDLKHSDSERRYFELLVRKEKHLGRLPPDLIDELRKLSPRSIQRKPLEAEVFSYVADWQNYVILQMFSMPSFHPAEDEKCAAWISSRLGGRLTEDQARSSLQLLEKLRFLERDKASGFLHLSAEDSLIATEEVPSAAGRKHHFEQMDQAKEALARQPLSEREFTALTMRVNRSDLPAMKKAIKEFREQFAKKFALDPGDDVCQLNVQFFFHTAEKKS